MLVPLQKKDFDKYIDFAYELALDPARTCYPVYYDGVKTRALFEADARKGISLPEDQILLYEEDGAIEGWLHYYYLPEDRYIAHRSCGVRRNTSRALQELSEHLAARYPGCEWAVGFPSENQEALDWVKAAGFELLEDSQYYTFHFDQYIPGPEDPSVERITEENFAKFQRVHHAIEGEMYWNCQRLREDLPSWDLFVAEEDGVAGEVMALDAGDGFYSIFGVVCEDRQFHESLYRRLLVRALSEGKRKGARYLTFFEDTAEEANRIMRSLGFHHVGRYLGYHKII